jgi:hypothetical protein
MLFHLTDFSALVPAQDCDTGITSLDPETMEEEIDFETMEEDIGFKTVEESLESQRESERRLMAFSEQDLVQKIENTKLHVSKDQLMKESAVFDRMLTSDFKENDQKEIELDGKNLNNFVDFLRCIMPGVDEDVTGKITLTYLKMYSSIFVTVNFKTFVVKMVLVVLWLACSAR